MTAVWNKSAQVFLACLVGLQLIPLLWVVPIWISAIAAILVIWKILHLMRGIALPPMKAVWLVGVIGFALIWYTKKTLIGEDASIAVLTMLAGCKLMETNRYRDIMITIILCFLLLMAHLLVSQGLGSAIYLVVDVMLMAQLLLQLHPSNNSLFSLRVVGRLLLIILPVWALLFVAFPRFTVGFWQREVPTARTGFSDELNPGSISQVAESDEIALRAQVDGDKVRPEDMYWRGSILSTTDGLRWVKSSRPLPVESIRTPAPEASRVSYQVWLEPLFQRWLFTLDYSDVTERVKVSNNQAYRRSGFYFEAQRPVVSRVSYSVNASLEAPMQNGLSPIEQKAFLQVPAGLEPEVKALALRLKSKKSTEESLENIYRYFRTENFQYTLSPGPVPGNRIGGFLFKSKVGFCEHYAAAGALMLRVMGIPARVVVGFQGAERNPLGDYWMVRNKNAHSWTEAWVENAEGGQWKRFDLVSAVTPTRLAMGANFFQGSGTLTGGPENQKDWLGKVKVRAQLLIDAVEMQWVRFLISYDFEYQQNLISKFGVQDASRLTFFVIVAIGLGIFLVILMWSLQRRSKVKDPVLEEWVLFCEKLAKAGMEKRVNEGPLDLMKRAQAHWPQHQAAIEQVIRQFIVLRYTRDEGSAPGQVRFKELVRAFSLKA
jgi:transglutaminase-like putative cysteine protease